MSENESKPYVDPNSGAAPQPGGFATGPVAVEAVEEPKEAPADPNPDGGDGGDSDPDPGSTDYSELLDQKVEKVQQFLDENPDQKDAVVAAEKDGQNRKGIIEY